MCSVDDCKLSSAVPSIFIGRGSELVGVELGKLADRCRPSGARDSHGSSMGRVDQSLYLNNDGYSGCNAGAGRMDGQRNAPFMKKCSHIFHAVSDHCPTCALNDEVAVGSINRMLESSDNPSQVVLINDTVTSFGASTSSLILSYLRDEVPSCSVLNVLMKPLVNYHSFESYYALLNTAAALDLSDCVVFRGYERCSMDEGKAMDSNVELSYRIACDLWPSLLPKLIGSIKVDAAAAAADDIIDLLPYQLWPFNISSSTGKVFDIRSSLYFNLKHISKQKKTASAATASADFYPLRSLSSNIHALHQSYVECYPDHWKAPYRAGSCIHPQTAIHASSYAGILIPSTSSPRRATQFSPPGAYSDHELAVLLNWATPGIQWPYSNSNTNSNTRSYHENPSKTDSATASSSSSTATQHMPINAANISSRMMDSERSGQPGRKRDDQKGDMLHCTANLVFESPYGRSDISFIVDNSQRLLRVGAYKHL